MDKLVETSYFASPVYTIQKPEFLESVKSVSSRYLEQSKNMMCGNDCKDCGCDKAKLLTMTGTYAHEESIAEFTQYVSQTAWNILSSQGYAMNNVVTYFTEMWTQEHQKYSAMETHVHGMGAQISAFYFLDTPPEGCKMVIHDPRPGKVIINMPETDQNKVTQGSTQIVFTPNPGMMVFTNSWLPHSFTRNLNDQPMRFVHMNLSVMLNPAQETNTEII